MQIDRTERARDIRANISVMMTIRPTKEHLRCHEDEYKKSVLDIGSANETSESFLSLVHRKSTVLLGRDFSADHSISTSFFTGRKGLVPKPGKCQRAEVFLLAKL